jgi:RND family efflux transporter MFP subunit
MAKTKLNEIDTILSSPHSLAERIKNFLAGIFKTKKRIAIAIVVLVIIIFGAIRIFQSNKTATQYQTAQAEKGTIISTVSASGQVLTSNITYITTQASGLVKTVSVKDGDKVYIGQKVAELTLDPDGAQRYAQAYSSYLSAKNSLASTQTNLYTLQASEFSANQKFINDAVARNLATNDPTYIQENATWLAAEATYKNHVNVIAQAQASFNNAALSLRNASSTLVSPVSGTIDNLTITPGMVISTSTSSSSNTVSSQQVAVIRSPGNPVISFNISELDVSKIQPNQKATITFDAITGKTFTGKVRTINRIGSTSSGVTNYPATIVLDTATSEILPNMSASANIITASKDNVLLVPSAAIITQNSQTMAKTLKGSEEEDVSVEIGLTSDTQTEVVSGLNEGDIVITGTVSQTTTSSSTRSIFSGGFGGGGGTTRIGR